MESCSQRLELLLLFRSGNVQLRENIKNLIIVDQVKSFALQPDEMRAIFPAFFSNTGIHTEKIGVSAIAAFSQRDANLRNSNMACIADGKQILAHDVMLAVLHFIRFFNEAENSATHKDMRAGRSLRFDLMKAFIRPINAILAICHESNFKTWNLRVFEV